jgi:zinc transporter 1/2/3
VGLLIALVFHQVFEGMALGGQMMKSHTQDKCYLVKYVMFFSLSCPVGVSIGAGICTTFSEGDAEASWIIGILNALACGTLMYIGMVEFLVNVFRAPQKGLKKFALVGSVTCGAAVMAILA